jgi:formamidopyrimidine-DNA glycosylase
MVEGPQSSFLAHSIRKRLNKKTLVDIKVEKGRYKTHPLKNLKPFDDVYKKGKVLFLFFHEWTIIIKLGMTGWFYFDEKDVDGDIIFTFENNKKLIFQDTRHFGTITITKDSNLILKELEKIAPDTLDPKLSFEEVRDRISSFNQNLSLDQVLIDQKLFLSGIGNIMKSEILYDAKISPKRKVSELNMKEWSKVFSSATKISRIVYQELMKGKNTNEFSKINKIYQKEYDPNGYQVNRYISKDNRVTFWVPEVQK